MAGGIHPKEFIIPWCETYNLTPSVARRLWVEGFQDGDTILTLVKSDLESFDLKLDEETHLLRSVILYKTNRTKVDESIELWTLNKEASNEQTFYKKDKRKSLKKNRPKDHVDPAVQGILNLMMEETPEQRREYQRRLRAKRTPNDSAPLAERILLQRHQLRLNGYTDGTVSAPPFNNSERPLSMTSVQTAPALLTDRQGYTDSIEREFGKTGRNHNIGSQGDCTADSGISDEDLDAILKEAEAIPRNESATSQNECAEPNHFTPEEEALMVSISSSESDLTIHSTDRPL